MNSLKRRLLDLIAQDGPLTIAQYMSFCLLDPEAGYYATRPALGGDGDFITAPETSQMFGELIGLWSAQSWLELGSPNPCQVIEFGPGRGALMIDLWRAGKALPAFRAAARLNLIEPSAPLRRVQGQRLAAVGARADWIDALERAPAGPAILIGNEFLDCLPVRQFLRTERGWRERVVGRDGEALVFGLAAGPAPIDLIPASLREAGAGAVAETRAGLSSFVRALAARLHAGPGRALFIDYGAAETTGGDTFQAVRAHRSADPLAEPGEADLTAHVDFAEIAALARGQGLVVAGPIGQGAFLTALGIALRAEALKKAQPEKAPVIARQLQRLIAPDQMGGLFQAICLSSPGLPPAAGFPP